MVSLWYKLITMLKSKRHALYKLSKGLVFFAILYILTKIFDASLCPIYHIFNVKCIGCGLTRGCIAALKLDFVTAYEYNILSIPICFSIIIYYLLSFIDVFFNRNCINTIRKFFMRKPILLCIIIIICFLKCAVFDRTH